jgi:hypothetical protein
MKSIDLDYSYPLLMVVEIILKRSFALTIFAQCAGITIDYPASSKYNVPSITISALPSIT